MVTRLSRQELEELLQVSMSMEQTLWLELESAATAAERITLIETMEEGFRPTFLAEENRDQLLDGLNEQERSTLNAWLIEQ